MYYIYDNQCLIVLIICTLLKAKEQGIYLTLAEIAQQLTDLYDYRLSYQKFVSKIEREILSFNYTMDMLKSRCGYDMNIRISKKELSSDDIAENAKSGYFLDGELYLSNEEERDKNLSYNQKYLIYEMEKVIKKINI